MHQIIPIKLLISPWFSSDLETMWDNDLMKLDNETGLSIAEDDKNIYVKAAVPGIDPKEVDITFDKGVLSIKAESSEKEENKKMIKQAKRSFVYELTVPGDIDYNMDPEAKCKNGMMTIKFVKSAHAQPKRITIKAE